MTPKLFRSVRLAALVTAAMLALLAASLYASLYVRALVLEAGRSTWIGVVGALFAALLCVFVVAFGAAYWTYGNAAPQRGAASRR